MGRVIVKVTFTNFADEILARRGITPEGQIRRVELEALVDTGATIVALPEDTVEELGLETVREVSVRYGNNSRAKKRVAGPARLDIAGRSTYCDILAEAKGSRPVIGQVVLEELDLLVDPKRQALVPNPDSPDMPLIELL